MTFRASVARVGIANGAMLLTHLITIAALGLMIPVRDFAVFMLGLSITQPFSAVGYLRLESAFPAVNARRELTTLLAIGFIAALIVAGLQYLIVAQLQSWRLFELQSLNEGTAAILPVITFLQTLTQVGRLWAIRFGRVDHIASATWIRACTTLIARGAILGTVYFVESQWTLLSIAGALLLMEVASLLVMTTQLYPAKALCKAFLRLKLLAAIAALRRNWKFPTLETVSTAIDQLAANAPIFLVAQFYGIPATANFGLAYRGVAVPVAQISKTLTEVMQVRYSELLRTEKVAEFSILFRRSTLLMAAASFVATVLAEAGLTLLAEIIRSPRYEQLIFIIAIIFPWVAASAIVNINSRLILMLKKQELKLAYDFFALISMIILFFLVPHAGLSLYLFLGLLTIIQISAYLLYFLLIRKAVESAVRI